jgi:protein-tyrosine-phosphatase
MANNVHPDDWKQDAEMIRDLKPNSLLFLCVANSARSQMAEGIARHLAPPGTKVYSAGSIPTTPHPLAIRTLQELGIDATAQTSKSVEELFGTVIDVVITLCQDEVCPIWLDEAAQFHWSFPDPAAGTQEKQIKLFAAVRNDLLERLGLLFQNQTLSDYSKDPAPAS